MASWVRTINWSMFEWCVGVIKNIGIGNMHIYFDMTHAHFNISSHLRFSQDSQDSVSFVYSMGWIHQQYWEMFTNINYVVWNFT